MTTPGTESKKKPPHTTPPGIKHDGDHGESIIASGEALPKDHDIFHAIGITEELTSSLG